MRLQKIVWTQILRDGHKNSLKNRLFCVVKQVYSEDLIRPTYFINYLFPDIKHIVNIHHTFTVCKDICMYGAKKHEHLQHDLVRTTCIRQWSETPSLWLKEKWIESLKTTTASVLILHTIVALHQCCLALHSMNIKLESFVWKLMLKNDRYVVYS